MNKRKIRRLALAGMLTAVMFIIGYVESLLPPFFSVPGIKPGFANIPVMIAINLIDWKAAAAMSFTRIIISGLTFSGLFACIYSLGGAVLSITIMVLMKKNGKFGIIGMSMTGGAVHNLGQVIVAVIFVGKGVLYDFPILVVSGLAAGMLTGIVTGAMLKLLSGKSFLDSD